MKETIAYIHTILTSFLLHFLLFQNDGSMTNIFLLGSSLTLVFMESLTALSSLSATYSCDSITLKSTWIWLE